MRPWGAALVLACACSGSTGGEVVEFAAAASGAAGVVAGVPFDTPAGWRVSLSRARLTVGAVYLRRVRPLDVVRATACVEPGDYVAQVTSGRTIDLLSTELQPLPVVARGTEDRALTGEVWLGSARIDEDDDPTTVLDVAGTASRQNDTLVFEGNITLGKNRAIAPRDPAQPGASPLCQQRIVTPVAVDLTPRSGGTLVLRVDAAKLFAQVDFAGLPRDAPPATPVRFRNVNEGQPDLSLVNALRSRDGVYTFEWAGR